MCAWWQPGEVPGLLCFVSFASLGVAMVALPSFSARAENEAREDPAGLLRRQGGGAPQPDAQRQGAMRRWSTVLIAWFCSSNLWKSTLIQSHLDSPVQLTAWAWVWQAVTLAALVWLCQALARQHWARLLWLLHLGLGCLFLFDHIYEGYFDDLPGVYLWAQLSQAGSTADSALEQVKSGDLVYGLDCLLSVFLLWRHAPAVKHRLRPLAGVAAAVLVALFSSALLNDDELRILRLRFRNVAAVQKLGLVHYHFYDVLQNWWSRWDNLLDSSYNEKMLKEVVGRSHASMRQATPLRGRYAGKNVLMFQLESVEAFVIGLRVNGQEVTPFLNRLARESFSGALQDQTGQGRSSDGEFVMLNGLLPPGERPLVYAYPSNTYRALPTLLAERGYDSCYGVPYYGSFWNCRFMSGRYGFKRGLFREELPNKPGKTIGWGLTDQGLLEAELPYWKKLSQPFFSYTVTMMGHYPYRELRASQCRLKLDEDLDDSMLGRYLQCCRERDEQWRRNVETLKKEGLWQNSLVVLFGDHDGRIPYEDMALLGQGNQGGLKQPIDTSRSYDEVDKDLNDRVFCLIHAPDGKLQGTFPPNAAQVDVAPTLVHLLGLGDAPTAMLGFNLLSSERRTVVISKSGYAIDDKHVAVDSGMETTVYARATHRSVTEPGAPAARELRDWFDLTRDILRLDLVPVMTRLP